MAPHSTQGIERLLSSLKWYADLRFFLQGFSFFN
jgi:hypothetical protein